MKASYDTVSVQQCQSSLKNFRFSKFGSPNKSRQDFFCSAGLQICSVYWFLKK